MHLQGCCTENGQDYFFRNVNKNFWLRYNVSLSFEMSHLPNF